MSQFTHGPVTQIATTSPTVYAFRITGHVEDDDAEAMAAFMNGVFDEAEEVDMLLDLSGFTGSDWDSLFDTEVLKSRWRSLSNVRRYVVVGAPEAAAKMIGVMNKIIPVDARAFEKADEAAAWDYVGARPVESPGASA